MQVHGPHHSEVLPAKGRACSPTCTEDCLSQFLKNAYTFLRNRVETDDPDAQCPKAGGQRCGQWAAHVCPGSRFSRMWEPGAKDEDGRVFEQVHYPSLLVQGWSTKPFNHFAVAYTSSSRIANPYAYTMRCPHSLSFSSRSSQRLSQISAFLQHLTSMRTTLLQDISSNMSSLLYASSNVSRGCYIRSGRAYYKGFLTMIV